MNDLFVIRRYNLTYSKPQTFPFSKLLPDWSERLQSRILTKGYLQMPGVDFTESFSPVTTDFSTRIILGITLFYSERFDWVCEAFDVEAAFLEPFLDIEMYIEWPEGMVELGFLTQEEYKNTCVQLRRSMYGNVDAALRWQREFSNYLVTDCGMKICRTDPCILFLRKDGVLKIIMSIHVDDSLCAGNKGDLEDLYEKIRKRYKITTLGKISKYLGVHYEWGNDEDGPYVIASMERNAKEIISYYEKVTKSLAKIAGTPGYQNTVLSKNENEIDMLDEYRALVGKLLFYTIKIGPDCANSVRDLAHHMSNPGSMQWKAMERIVGYLKGKRLHGLIFRKPEALTAVQYCDANYATDPDLRRSVSGMISTIGGMIVNWSSRTQKIVTLSSTESEYVALGECGQELKFICMFLQEIGVGKVPGVIFEDNEGAIFLAKNQQVGMRTKHIDVKYHFIRDLIKDKYLDLVYVRSKDNYADLMTKNVGKDTLEKLFSNGMQVGCIETKRENVGRTSDI